METLHRRASRASPDGRPRRRAARARLRTEAQLLRLGRGHRTVRRGATSPFRASRSGRCRDRVGQTAPVLRRGQHSDAGAVQPCPQGQFLQVHQRNPQRRRGSRRRIRPAIRMRDQRLGLGRRLRIGVGVRPDRADRRRFQRGLAARGATAGGIARYRRPDTVGGQTWRAARPRRLLLHHVGRRAWCPRPGLEFRGRTRPALAFRRGRPRTGRGVRGALGSACRRPRDRAYSAAPDVGRGPSSLSLRRYPTGPRTGRRILHDPRTEQ